MLKVQKKIRGEFKGATLSGNKLPNLPNTVEFTFALSRVGLRTIELGKGAAHIYKRAGAENGRTVRRGSNKQVGRRREDSFLKRRHRA